MTEAKVRALIDHLAAHSMVGDVMQDTGGCRKLRRAGKGKRGTYRTIMFYSGDKVPVFLVTVFSKGERANLSQAEQNAFAKVTKTIADEYCSCVMNVGNARCARGHSTRSQTA